ncbi:GNAT family N-acetyltransferase [Spirillospora sp. NPDC048911]|uniref:GNAT family N-acetyltransferase n=1 Tax=Spirillospora sp. NPDC048911 TaxID=3364527 RepID=UPI00371E23F5
MLGHVLAENAVLRALEPWQAEEFAAHVDVVRDDLLPWIPFARMVVDVDSARSFLQGYADRQAADGGRIYGIWVDGVLAGGVLFRVFNAEIGVCEVGVWLGAGARGRGLVTMAVRHMVDWAMNVRGMARVEWRCDPENANSRAAAKRLGFTHEATLRSTWIIEGERHDEEIWALVKD